MRRGLTVTASTLAGLALATAAGCSSGSSSSGGANPAPTSAAAGSASHAAASPTASAVAATAPTSGSGGVNACSLLTAGQATKLNKVTYSTATPGHPTNGYDTCTYKNTGSPDPVDIQNLTLTVLSVAGCWTALQSADGPGKAVSGIGDAAFGAQIGLDIKVGSRCVTIQGLTHAELLGNYAPDVAMAHVVLGKLG